MITSLTRRFALINILLVVSSLGFSQAISLEKSIVKIEVSTENYDYSLPWSAPRFSGGIGTGFLIGENQFLTNAHVVSNARQILISSHNVDKKYTARIKYIAHDCDLALLEIEDFTDFEDVPVLTFKEVLPTLDSTVKVIGFPMGGNRISITKGIVSRIDFTTYVHSGVDSHLILQVDAAINPGNSGGPAFQGEEVVGVAFQGLTSADNTGYLIPVPVIKRFLTDIEDGSYDGYVELGISYWSLEQDKLRDYYKIKDSQSGVLISQVMPHSSADGILKPGDFLTKIDGITISNTGFIQLKGNPVPLYELAERKFTDDTLEFELIRDGQLTKANVTLDRLKGMDLYKVIYGEKPAYLFFSGLAFQPLNQNSLAAHKLSDPSLLQAYNHHLQSDNPEDELLALTHIESDLSTAWIQEFKGALLLKVNDIDIISLTQLHEVIQEQSKISPHLHFTFSGFDMPLILDSKDALQNHERLLNKLKMAPFYFNS